jgi:hypothetical protein
MKKKGSERGRRKAGAARGDQPRLQSRIVRRSDSLGRSYYVERESGKRTSGDAWRSDQRRIEKSRAARERRGTGTSEARVVRRKDSADRDYYIDVGSGRRVSRNAWEIDLERRRAVKKVPKGEKRRAPRPMGTRGPRETHELGKPEVPPFPRGVTERGVPKIEELVVYGDEPVDIEPIEDEADYDEGSGA